MYSTCLFCHRPLGANDLIERFPVGRRLAFDAEKGRLWVVCTSCHRWNLTPLEERWEAVEDLERRVRATHFRVSTDNIGLARLPGGLDAVRIGRPLRPEMASWRYGRVIGRRYRRYAIPTMVATGLTVSGGIAFLVGLVPPLGAAAMFAIGIGSTFAVGARGTSSKPVTLRGNDGQPIRLAHAQLVRMRLLPQQTVEGWALEAKSPGRTTVLTGTPALRASAILLARLNWDGAKSTVIDDATRYVDASRTPHELIARIARTAAGDGVAWPNTLSPDVRLAWEMATHDSSEREAFDGELASLEAAWRDAETIAAIADQLLLPDSIGEKVESLRTPE
jgi:hypothetical protein